MSIVEPGFFKTAVTNLESIEASLRQLWDRLAPETRLSYGEDFFHKCEWGWGGGGLPQFPLPWEGGWGTQGHTRCLTPISLSSPAPPRPQGAAPHHERHLRRRPQQGDALHGARAGRPPPPHTLQRRLGRQAALAARLLPARLPRRLRPGHHPAQAGPPRPLAPPLRPPAPPQGCRTPHPRK